MTLPLAIGRDEYGRPLWLDLAAAPNILLAGYTKQGKFVAMNAMIASLMLLEVQEEVEFIFIDPKRAELAVWAGVADSRYAGGESEACAELSWTGGNFNESCFQWRDNQRDKIERIQGTYVSSDECRVITADFKVNE